MSVPTVTSLLHTFNWVANQRQTEQLPKANWYDALELRLSGSMTIATADGTAVIEGNPCSLVKLLQLKANANTFRSLRMNENYLIDNYQYKTAPDLLATGLTQATHPFYASSFIDMGLQRGDHEGFLPAKLLKQLELAIEWGTYTDLVTPDATTVESWAVVPKLEVYGHMITGRPPIGSGKYGVQMTELLQTITALGDMKIDLPERNEYVGLFVFTTDNSLRNDSIVTKWDLISDVTKHHITIDHNILRGQNKSSFNLESVPTGMAYIPIRPPLQAGRASKLSLIATCIAPTGVAQVRVIPVERVYKGR